jgi:hypothetical protein
MFRLSAYHQCGGYPAGFPHADDMLLAVRMAELGDVAYLDRELYAFRQHGANIHLGADKDLTKREILPIIGMAFAGPLGQRVQDAAVRRRITRNALVHGPSQAIFSGRLWEGWRLYASNVRMHPVLTIVQRRTISLVIRSVLGQRGYCWLAKLLNRLRDGMKQRRVARSSRYAADET